MIVADFRGAREVSTPIELEAVLKTSYGHDANSFWLSHPLRRDPSLAILVKRGSRKCQVFCWRRQRGIQIRGTCKRPGARRDVHFHLDSEKLEQPMLNDSVVPISDALKAATEFLVSEALPTSVGMAWALRRRRATRRLAALTTEIVARLVTSFRYCW
jgi:hypothetical protein